MSSESNQTCGLFDFMANEIGIKVLHPGGYASTKALCDMCQINEDSNVLDVACGVGTTSFYIREKYDCPVTGIDISETLIEKARSSLATAGHQNKIEFKVADALKLPYPDQCFDVVISQAFFILIDEQEKALSEINRVLKPNGFFGSLELSWFSSPPEEAFHELMQKTCSDFIPRVKLFDEWEALFQSRNFNHVSTSKFSMQSGMLRMIESEGFSNFFKIMGKMMKNPDLRKRMMAVQNTFAKYDAYLGYGIYCYQKVGD